MIREPNWTRRQKNELKMLYETGIPDATIAERLGRTISALRTRAHICGYRRPKRLGRTEISALQTHAVNLGLDGAILPTNPTALRILICLAENDIVTKPELDKACAISSSGRNKAIQSLRSLGLVFADGFCSPAEVILTRKAYRTRPEPVLADQHKIRIGKLPTMETLEDELDNWLPACFKNEASIETYRAFIVRQLENAQSGDVLPADFYSIFYSLNRK